MGLSTKVTIEIDGQKIKDFVNFAIHQSIYDLNHFEVVFRLSTFEEHDTFPMSNSINYIGSTISISVEGHKSGHTGSSQALFFKGIITSVKASKSDLENADEIILSGYSPEVLLLDNPGSKSFSNKGLKQVVDDVLKPYPKDILKTKVDTATTTQLLYTVQYDESRYEFLRRLAKRHGEWLFYNGTELIFGKLPDDKLDLVLGKDLSNFDYALNLQALNYQFVTHDYMKLEDIKASSSSSTGKSQLNSTGASAYNASSRKYTQQSIFLNNHLNVADSSLNKETSNAVDLKGAGLALDMTQAKGSGTNPFLKVGTKAHIKAKNTMNAETTDYGEYIITSVTHTCDNLLNYQNHFIGVPSNAKNPDYTDPLSYPKASVQAALVKDNKDPEKLGRVKVTFGWQENDESPWVRVATPSGGKEKGFYFIPEVGEEVLVGFEDNDAERPYIIGGVFNGKNKPDPKLVNDKNEIKYIRTAGGNTIEITDTNNKEEISIYQKNDKDKRNHITLTSSSSAQGDSLTIFTGGDLTIEANNIKISAKQKFTLDAGTSISQKSGTDMKIEAGTNLSAKATTNAQLEGVNVTNKATAQLKAEGAQVSVSGQAMTEIKGALVKIN